MTTMRNRGWVATAALGAVALYAGTAEAQLDINQPMPNVLLMIDTSGSMEYMPDGTLPAVCQPNQASDLNRWGTVIEVLTGTINNRGCVLQDRSTADFDSEFSISSNSPYDLGYFLPYHRYTSNDCIWTPGNLPAAIFNWNPQPVQQRDYTDLTFNGSPSTCQSGTVYDQANDGLLDTYRDRVRFSNFMFDSRPDDGVGFQGIAFNASGIDGHWSYFNGWESGGTSPISGNPPNCSSSTFEVGARNFAAPPWEGRMVPFGSQTAPISDIRTNNERIQQIINATRPYGATPLAGMFSDAWVYFHEDLGSLPGSNADDFIPPRQDALFRGGCRESYIVLLSDGEPNLDMRPECGTGNGVCPYDEPWEYAQDLANPPNPDHTVQTFVVGFGVSSGTGFDCKTLSMPSDLNSGGACDGATGALEACCTLSRVAYEGGTSNAYFADDATSLSNAIAAIFDQIATASTSRTLPVVANATATQAGNSNAPAVSYEFGSSFVPEPGELWKGALERKRWECATVSGNLTPQLQAVDNNLGDDFADNVNQGKLSTPRQFWTVIGDTVGGEVDSKGSIRPNLGSDEGLGLYSGTPSSRVDVSGISSLASTNPLALGIPLTPLPGYCTNPDMNATSDSQCAERLMRWEVGGTTSGLPTRDGNEFGAIYHSNPAVIGQPSAFIRDAGYERFVNLQALRPLMLYTATVDGQLHAFKIATNDSADNDEIDNLDNNELWSFMPPHVLKDLHAQYPGTPTILLDGAPIVKDVPFERTLTQAIDGGQATGADWRTVLVAGGGAGGGFYYALDVTDPYNPTFLWQISTDTDGDKLFGPRAGQPAIATLAVEENLVVKEVGVAILPGGYSNSPSKASGGSHCHRDISDFNHIDTTSYTPHRHINCWDDDEPKSITIVRLDTGEVLRRFEEDPNNSGSAQLPSSIVTQFDFDAPIITATPFPSGTGQVSNRIYLSDQDGTLWRVDLSDPDPTQWEVHIMFDAYSFSNDDNGGGSFTGTGEPIATAPTISVDGVGNTILVFGTGDQDDFSDTVMEGRIWSLTEYPETVGTVPFRVGVNWVLGDPIAANGSLDAGERVLGPISVFDEVAYFSTFTPPPANSDCDVGRGRIWAVDFAEPAGSTVGPEPEPRFPDGLGGFKYNPDVTDSASLSGDPTIYGVAVTAEPSCTEETSVTDDYVGQHTTLTQSVPPVFKLRFHTGVEGSADAGSTVNSGELTVPQPRTQGFIDSWASVVE